MVYGMQFLFYISRNACLFCFCNQLYVRLTDLIFGLISIVIELVKAQPNQQNQLPQSERKTKQFGFDSIRFGSIEYVPLASKFSLHIIKFQSYSTYSDGIDWRRRHARTHAHSHARTNNGQSQWHWINAEHCNFHSSFRDLFIDNWL